MFKGTWRIIRFIFSSAGKWLWRARKVLLGVIVIFSISYGAFNYYATFLLKREYAKIHQQQEPLYFTQVINRPVPDSENAALLYIQAEQALKLPKDDILLTAKSQKQASAIVHDNQKSMQLVEHASRLSQCSFPLKWNGDPADSLNPNMTKMRTLARFIRLNALKNVRENNYRKAFQQIGFINLLAERTANGDTLISFLVARAINGIAVRTTDTILQNAKLTKEQALEYSNLLHPIDWHRLFYENMCGERAFGVSSYVYYLSDIWNRRATEEDKWDIDDEDESSDFKQKGFLTRPFLKMDEVQSLRLWTKVLSEAKKPGAVGTDYEDQIQNRLKQLPFYASGAKRSHEVFANSFRNRDRAEVDQCEQEIAFALNAYKTENGKYPETLIKAERFWGKKFPLDPYDNQSFHYRSANNDYVLYSVGPNRIDDGGIKQPKDKWQFDKMTDFIWGDHPN